MTSSPHENVTPDRIISISECSERLGVSLSNLQRMRARGEIKVLQISPRRVGIRESELLRVQSSLKEAPISLRDARVPRSPDMTHAA